MKWSSFFFIVLPFASFWCGYSLIHMVTTPTIHNTPSIIGLSLSQACLVIANHNNALRVARTIYDTKVPDGTIIDQVPAAGHALKEYQSIAVTITQQPPACIAPQYVGLSTSSVQKHAHDQAIRIKEYDVQSTQPSNVCVAQIPHPGQPCTNDPLIVYHSQPRSAVAVVPQYHNHSIPDIKEHMPSSIALTIIHQSPVQPNHQCNNHCIVTEQRPLAGSFINLDNNSTVLLHVHNPL